MTEQSPEDKAKELLKNYYDKEEFFFDDYCRDDRLISSFYQSMKWWEKQRKKYQLSNPVFSARILTELMQFVYNKALTDRNETLLASILHFKELYSESNSTEENSALNKFLLGEGMANVLVYLKANGSSVKQGLESLSKWSGQSASNIERHYIHLQFKEDLLQTTNTFSLNEIKLMRVLLQYKDNEFPSKGAVNSPAKKTFNAFEKFKSDFKEHITNLKKARFVNVEFFDLEDPHVRYEELRQEFLTQF